MLDTLRCSPARPFLAALALLAAPVWAAEPATPAAQAPVPASATAIRPITVGSPVDRTLSLRRTDGSAATLGDVLAGKPTVLVFYRGGWCPFCTTQLAALGKALPEMQAAGWQVAAVAPDQPAVLAKAQAATGDGVVRWSDADGHVMRALGLAFIVDAATDAKLKGYGIDLTAAAGNDAKRLPVPAVLLVGADGTVRFVHADPDYKRRFDTQALLAVARSLGG